MKLTKNLAKRQIENYSQLLLERAVIGPIHSENKRDSLIAYSFEILTNKVNYPIECCGVKELALILTTMWLAYERAYEQTTGISEQ